MNYKRQGLVLLIVILLFAFSFMQKEVLCVEDGGAAVITTKDHVTKTKDGWEISIKRYILKDAKPEERKGAVILCHGFNFNNLFWDIDKRSSLSRYLAKNGYDVWTPSLRGSGLSSKPIGSSFKEITRLDVKNIPRNLAKAPSDITKVNWTIDDHIHNDIPAIIKYVKEKSGFNKVYWIGHSMGGLIIIGYLETEGHEDIAGFIPIGSMAVIPQPLSPQLQRIADQEQIHTASLVFNTRVAADLRSLTRGGIKYPIEELLLKRENMYEDTLFKLFRECIDDTSSGVIKQFSRSIREGGMVTSKSSKTQYNYTENLHRITTPVLIMAGSEDAFVTKETLKSFYKRLSSRDKKLVIFSKKNGYSAEYGHSDIIIGKDSEKEVYPVILDWLDKRRAKKPLAVRIKDLSSEPLNRDKRAKE